jgi:hypothetical protein
MTAKPLLISAAPARSIVFLAAVLFLSACASFEPGSITDLRLHERAVTQSEAGVTVNVALLSREQAAQFFGAELHKRGIQPVWLEIQNSSDAPVWLMLSGIDPNYFSAHEAAYMHHKRFSGQANREMDAWFSSAGIDQLVVPGATQSGFVFSNETLGTKQVGVQLLSDHQLYEFNFFVSVPDLLSEWDRKDLERLYPEADHVNTQSEEELRAAIEKLPCCTQKENGSGSGEPLNIVFIGDREIIGTLIMAGWDETIFRPSLQSLFGDAYLFGRIPDVQFQKTRNRSDSKSLVRLWVTPIRYRGELVVIGSIKRDIDPNADAAALYLLEDLISVGQVQRFGKVDGVPAVERSAPSKTLTNDPYWTEGGRLVIEIAPETVALFELDTFPWRWEKDKVFQPAADDVESKGAGK